MNKPWHKDHPMPAKADVEQRVSWHMAHQQFCACRPIPKKLMPLIDELLKTRQGTKQ